MLQKYLQNVTAVLFQNTCGKSLLQNTSAFYYKMRQLLQNVSGQVIIALISFSKDFSLDGYVKLR